MQGKIIEIGTAEERFIMIPGILIPGDLFCLPRLYLAGEKGNLESDPRNAALSFGSSAGRCVCRIRGILRRLAIDYEQTPPMFKSQ